MTAPFLTIAAAARAVNKDRAILSRWVRDGVIPPTVAITDPESGRVWIKAAALTEWLAGRVA